METKIEILDRKEPMDLQLFLAFSGGSESESFDGVNELYYSETHEDRRNNTTGYRNPHFDL